MSIPRVSLRSFLSTAKKALNGNGATAFGGVDFRIVVGNESADLDSICSAVVLAYLRTYAPRSTTFYIPLSNLRERDLGLRPELVPVLRYAGLERGDLITRGDLEVVGGRGGLGMSKWVLVDHNALQGELGERFAGRVVGCVDHHDEEGKVRAKEECEAEGEMRIVERAGSCASLVVGFCRGAWEALSEEKVGGGESQDQEGNGDTVRWDAELARLAIAPVLVDTTCLGDVSKTTEKDREVVQYLEEWIRKGGAETMMDGNASKAYSSQAYWKEITDAKEDIGALEFEDILRKDYKEWTENTASQEKVFKLGIGSVVKDLEWLVGKAGGEEAFLGAVGEFAQGRGLDLFSIMTTSTNEKGIFVRELMVWGTNDTGATTARRFEDEHTTKLELSSWREGGLDGEGEGLWRKAWFQGHVACSRKQVAPMLQKAIQT